MDLERDLAEALGHEPRGYVDLDTMLAAEPLDALAILSPAVHHATCLEAALAARLHCLCEKPLVWGVADPTGTARRLVEGFASAGLTLFENCQWPYTLEAFEALQPGVLSATPRRFEMELAPSVSGPPMLVDSLSHPLSVLQALAPAEKPRIEAPRFDTRDAGERIHVGFRWQADAGTVDDGPAGLLGGETRELSETAAQGMGAHSGRLFERRRVTVDGSAAGGWADARSR